jgi:kynurenine 3-monooxygenase
VDRRKLNDALLSMAESYPNVDLHFGFELASTRFDDGQVTFLNRYFLILILMMFFIDILISSCNNGRKTEEKINVKADLIVGADGAYSATRRELMKKTRMNFSQRYIEHGYQELTIPATADNQFALAPDRLHIWPRHTFMMIALPNTVSFSRVL